jgi:signal transduction histidine kinase/ligand-binding sensor domain-containing protein
VTAQRAGTLSRWLLVAVGAVGAAQPAHGLDPSRATSQYVRDRWGSGRGYPGGAVRAITQTADGYLWIGTERGLVRFDGLEFAVVRPGAKATSGQVLGLCPGPQGELWVRLAGPNVLVYRDGDLQAAVPRVPPLEDAFTSMTTTRAGGILLAGLVTGISRSTRDGFETVVRSVAARSPVVAMGEASDGRVWLGTGGAGLFYVEDGQAKAVVRGLPGPKINCVLPVGGSEVWVGTESGVVRWDGAALVTTGVPPALRQVAALAMVRDRDSNVWVGTRTGLWRVNASGAALLLEAPSRPRVAVTALFEDREGDIWAGDERGIERLRDSRFATYGEAEGLPSDRNGPVYVDPDGRTWFAPLGGGLYLRQGGRVSRVDAAGLGADVVYTIAGARDGIWVGRRRGGLTHLTLRQGRVESRTFTRADGLVQDSVYAVHECRDGTLWVASLSKGVSRVRDGHFRTFTAADGLASDTVASIVDDAEGTTWFATPSGLSALSKDGWRTYTTRDGLPSDEVDCLWNASSGGLWIGTGEGLAFRESGRIQRVALEPLAPGEQVVGLAEDRGGWLWLATSRRVLRVKASPRGSAPAVEVTEFGHPDGLRGVEGVKRHRSVVGDSQGRIWLSTGGGLSVIEPASLREPEPVGVRVVAVAADGKALRLGEDVVVPATRQRIAFRFEGVSLSAPERLRFRYLLGGFDQEWREPTSSREADYTNLAPGSYAFRVRAFSLGEGWIGPEAALGVVVEPAPWQRGWVRLGAVLVCGVALAGLYRLRVGRVTRQLNLRFEERLSERLRIAQELHDTLLQGLASASMQLHVARDQLSADSSAQPLLGRVQQLMTQVIEEGRDALRGLRSPRSDTGDLGEALARVPDDIASRSPASLRVIVEGSPRPLRPLVRDEVYRIGREALANAFRHAEPTRVEVEIEYGARALRLLVRDDGRGIDPGVLRSGRDGHFGLSGMRERAEEIGARFTVRSASGAGTEVELSVRGSLAFVDGPATGPLAWLRRLHERRTPEPPTSTGGAS